jgi:hypothetical protein
MHVCVCVYVCVCVCVCSDISVDMAMGRRNTDLESPPIIGKLKV